MSGHPQMEIDMGDELEKDNVEYERAHRDSIKISVIPESPTTGRTTHEQAEELLFSAAYYRELNVVATHAHPPNLCCECGVCISMDDVLCTDCHYTIYNNVFHWLGIDDAGFSRSCNIRRRN